MRVGGGKAKGRRLQVQTAEAIARVFKLTIEASPPTKPGKRNGVVYVREEEKPDIRIRRMGQPGDDVKFLTPRALEALRIPGGNKRVAVECKNLEMWDLASNFWRSAESGWIQRTLEAQIKKHPQHIDILLVISKNQWPIMAIFYPYTTRPMDLLHITYLKFKDIVVMRLEDFLILAKVKP